MVQIFEQWQKDVTSKSFEVQGRILVLSQKGNKASIEVNFDAHIITLFKEGHSLSLSLPGLLVDRWFRCCCCAYVRARKRFGVRAVRVRVCVCVCVCVCECVCVCVCVLRVSGRISRSSS